MQLTDLIPKDATFKLQAFPETEFVIRKFTVKDEIWMQQNFLGQIEDIFKEMKMREICRIIFHQLKDEQKALFKKQDAKIVNEEGEEATISTGGYMLLAHAVSGINEKIEVVKSLLEAIGISRPMMEKLEEDEKKSLSKLIGPSSLSEPVMSSDGL